MIEFIRASIAAEYARTIYPPAAQVVFAAVGFVVVQRDRRQGGHGRVRGAGGVLSAATAGGG